MAGCDACGAGVISMRVRRWQAMPTAAGGVSITSAPVARGICRECGAWLAGVLGLTTTPGSATPYGMPAHGGRKVVFTDQCRLCRMPATADAIFVAVDASANSAMPASAALLCGACKTWFLSLIADMRSVRGLAARSIDGPYGHIVHSSIGPLAVGIAIVEPGARDLITAVSEQMGATTVESVDDRDVTADVLFVELALPSDPVDLASYPGRLIALVPEALRTRLPEVAAIARADWITLPVTPQQVTHALLRASRFPGGLLRDVRTALPIAVEPPTGSPLLAVDVAAGVDGQLVAWRLKRYARGYDEVVVTVDGVLLVVPRCEPRLVAAVARRLNGLLAGLASVAPAELTPRQGIDVSG